MKRSLSIFLLLSAFVLLSSCTNAEPQESAVEQSEAKKASQEEIKAYIKAMEDTLAMAYNTKDVSLFEKFYGEGAITYGEGREQLFGKKNIVNHFKQNVVDESNGTGTFKYQTIDVFSADDLAVETGRWEELDDEGKEKDHGFYMVVFEKQDGRYVSIRDIWNSSTLKVPVTGGDMAEEE